MSFVRGESEAMLNFTYASYLLPTRTVGPVGMKRSIVFGQIFCLETYRQEIQLKVLEYPHSGKRKMIGQKCI